MFYGSLVALITPMTKDGEIDIAALKHLVNWHIERGTHCIVPTGTTGESPVLSFKEHCQVITTVVAECAGRVPVIAGCGSNSTANAIELHAHAHAVGADAALHVTGYYNRPGSDGIYAHYKAISDCNDLPIIVYNIPPRTTVDISVETMRDLSELRNVIGVKDSTRDLTRPYLEKMLIKSEFTWLSGEDITTVAYNASGGSGCISVTANVVPGICAAMQKACLDGDYPTAIKIQQSLLPLHKALSAEPSPAGAKYACSKLGLCTDHLRLPMVGLSARARSEIDRALLATPDV